MVFPENTSDMPDRIWETYCCLLNCNSLNAQAGSLKYKDPWLRECLLYTQSLITHLLMESGRLDELKAWKEKKGETNG